MAQIIKRGDQVYLIRVFLGRDESGRRNYHNETFRGTLKDAGTRARDLERSRDTGTLIQPASLTLGAYLEEWLKTAAKPRLARRTFTDYSYMIGHYVPQALRDLRLSNVTPLHVQKMYADLLVSGLSARTVRYVHAVLSSALKQAVKWRILAINPTDAVDLPRQRRTEMKALTPDEAIAFQQEAAKDPLGVLFLVAITGGLRPEEYLALQWRTDVDLSDPLRPALTINRVLVRATKGEWYFAEPKTSQSRRTVQLPSSVGAVLLRHKREQAERRIKNPRKWKDNDLVFTTKTGTPVEMRNVRRSFRRVLEQMFYARIEGLPEDEAKRKTEAAERAKQYRLYDLRHTCATLLLAGGEHPKVVAERLGHSNTKLTLDTYSHVLPSMQDSAAQKLEAMLFAPVVPKRVGE